ncbi:MAG TPA: diacylglycerol kinase family protein [bacterium]|nr:diacylglycerol kinase family protein [bacterium]
MNIFLYDDYLDKYKKKVRKIEETLNKLNLQGKILYLNNIKNIDTSLQNEINSGAKTIVVVGNNKTLNNIVNYLANISEKIPVAIIPVGPNNSIAESLGIIDEKEACYVLSSRRIENVKLITANNLLAIKDIYIAGKDVSLDVDKSYNLKLQKDGDCFVFNIPPKDEYLNDKTILLKDNNLNLYIKIGSKNKTYLKAKKIEINKTKEKAIIDNSIALETPLNIETSNKQIPLIVGKDRTFNL